MPNLSTSKLLEAWSVAINQHPIDKALTILAFLKPANSLSQLAELSVGQRNILLLKARENLFGRKMQCFVNCELCKEALQFNLDTHSFYKNENNENDISIQQFIYDSYKIIYRLINSYDLAEVVRQQMSLEAAREFLLRHSMLTVEKDNVAIEFVTLPAEVISKYAAHISSQDPCAIILITMQCPACTEKYDAQLDIIMFLWQEINLYVQNIMAEIHILAYAYGWSEAEILAMDNARKKFYLSRLT